MGILNDLRNRVAEVNDGLQSGELVRDVIVQHPFDILDLQKLQLFEGKTPDGKDIRPYYTEDLKPNGRFYSVESAKRYAAWKESAIVYPYSVQRNPDAPNLYVNGRFHNDLDVQFGTSAVSIIGLTGYAREIMAKYGPQTFGLSWMNWMRVFIEYGAYNELMQNIKSKLYANG